MALAAASARAELSEACLLLVPVPGIRTSRSGTRLSGSSKLVRIAPEHGKRQQSRRRAAGSGGRRDRQFARSAELVANG